MKPFKSVQDHLMMYLKHYLKVELNDHVNFLILISNSSKPLRFVNQYLSLYLFKKIYNLLLYNNSQMINFQIIFI